MDKDSRPWSEGRTVRFLANLYGRIDRAVLRVLPRRLRRWIEKGSGY
jgi:hypothetical protein